MSRFRAHIETAYAAAPFIEQRNGLWVMPEVDWGRPVVDEDPTAPSDDDPAIINPDGFPITPHDVVATSPEDLKEVLDAAQWFTDSEVTEDQNIRMARHENAHRFFAREVLGAKVSLFMARLFRVPDRYYLEQGLLPPPNAHWLQPLHATSVRTTRLGVTLISAFPSDPSPGDRQMIEAMGYKGLSDVGMRAREKGFPEPLWLSGGRVQHEPRPDGTSRSFVLLPNGSRYRGSQREDKEERAGDVPAPETSVAAGASVAQLTQELMGITQAMPTGAVLISSAAARRAHALLVAAMEGAGPEHAGVVAHLETALGSAGKILEHLERSRQAVRAYLGSITMYDMPD